MEVPATEEGPRNAFGEYGLSKAEMERYLLAEARQGGFPATVLHPGHIVGRGWAPVNPQGNFNPAVFSALARGEELALPNLGLETVHHVHADDVAQAFVLALRALERGGRGELPRGLPGGPHPARLRRGGRRPGSAGRPPCASCPGRSGAAG